jgi:hypothetical protein
MTAANSSWDMEFASLMAFRRALKHSDQSCKRLFAFPHLHTYCARPYGIY